LPSRAISAVNRTGVTRHGHRRRQRIQNAYPLLGCQAGTRAKQQLTRQVARRVKTLLRCRVTPRVPYCFEKIRCLADGIAVTIGDRSKQPSCTEYLLRRTGHVAQQARSLGGSKAEIPSRQHLVGKERGGAGLSATEDGSIVRTV
jgi:hypothetical protein